MTIDRLRFNRKQKIAFGTWLFIKLFLMLTIGWLVENVIDYLVSRSSIREGIFFDPVDAILFAFLFVAFSDMYNFWTVRRLRVPGSAITLLMTLSILDFMAFVLGLALAMIDTNLRMNTKLIYSQQLHDVLFIVAVILVKNWAFSFLIKRKRTVSH
jgi:hypothetical protein